jgi:signal transduction histidine kinase
MSKPVDTPLQRTAAAVQDHLEYFAALRQAAERQLREQRPMRASTDAELHRLVHELEVYQIELEMQNEQLLGARAAADAGLERAIEQEASRAASGIRAAEWPHRLLAMQEEERRRLAAELHDKTSPNLVAVMLNFEILCSDLPLKVRQKFAALLQDTRALIDDTVAGIRDICANLRPAALDYFGLMSALKSYTDTFSGRTGTKVHLKGPDFMVRLPSEQEISLFRLVQEALTNCAKHAQATSIDIELIHSTSNMVLTITDDGVGFDPNALERLNHKPGLGLLTMKERAEFAGGKFSIESSPGNGTRIRVEL